MLADMCMHPPSPPGSVTAGRKISYNASYMSQTRAQQRFVISEVAADWHELTMPILATETANIIVRWYITDLGGVDDDLLAKVTGELAVRVKADDVMTLLLVDLVWRRTLRLMFIASQPWPVSTPRRHRKSYQNVRHDTVHRLQRQNTQRGSESSVGALSQGNGAKFGERPFPWDSVIWNEWMNLRNISHILSKRTWVYCRRIGKYGTPV